MTPVDEANPMPDASSVTITGSGTATLGPITYTKPGDYLYTVTQKEGSEAYFTYDTTSYTVTVRVINDGEGGLTAEIWAIEEGGVDKVDEILFENSYDPPAPAPKPTPKPTPVKHTTAKVTSASPKTGDEMNLVVLGCLLGISLLGLIALTVVFLLEQKTQLIPYSFPVWKSTAFRKKRCFFAAPGEQPAIDWEWRKFLKGNCSKAQSKTCAFSSKVKL